MADAVGAIPMRRPSLTAGGGGLLFTGIGLVSLSRSIWKTAKELWQFQTGFGI
jgi:hypothetical protein